MLLRSIRVKIYELNLCAIIIPCIVPDLVQSSTTLIAKLLVLVQVNLQPLSHNVTDLKYQDKNSKTKINVLWREEGENPMVPRSEGLMV